MALNLSGLFHTNVSDMHRGQEISQSHVSKDMSSAQKEVQLQELTPGRAFRGEVVGKNGQEIQIRIAKDMIINAKMEQNVTASEGQSVTFEVRSNSSGVISLRPLFQNLSQENNALKALTQAGIESDAKSMQMIFSMMQEGMSISKDSVLSMYKQVMAMPEADVNSLVQMERLQIPITPENIQQFEAYKNYEHQLVSSFQQVADEIPQAVSELFASGELQDGNALIGKLLTIFQEGSNAGADLNESALLFSGEPVGIGNGEVGQAIAGEAVAGEAQTAIADEILVQQDTMVGDTAEQVKEAIGDTAEQIKEAAGDIAKQTNPMAEDASIQPQGMSDGEPQQPESINQTLAGGQQLPEDTLKNEKASTERETMAALVKDAGGTAQQAAQIQEGLIGKEDIYQLVKELSQKAHTPEKQVAVKELFLSEGFQKIFKDKVSGQWMLDAPANVEKEEVSKLYERMNEQTRELTKAISEAIKGDSPLMRSVQNIRENVEFMNQLNQMYTYVQLPLKFNSSSAHGDLYVYTNKKNLAKKDGNVSAFLHLDMEHLGTVDVYVAMEQGKINTNFYLEDEDSLLLLEKNMDILTKRLTEKGYRAQATLTLKDGPGNVMEEIIKTDKNISIISEQSFDVRA